MRGRLEVDLRDGWSGTTELSSVVRGEIAEGGHRARGVLRTRSEILVRRADLEEAPTPECSASDASLVIGAIRERTASIRACYEEALREDPTRHGRLDMRMRLDVDGRMRDVHATSDTLGSPHVAACVARLLSEIRFRWGPAGGAVHYGFPFVFAPNDP